MPSNSFLASSFLLAICLGFGLKGGGGGGGGLSGLICRLLCRSEETDSPTNFTDRKGLRVLTSFLGESCPSAVAALAVDGKLFLSDFEVAFSLSQIFRLPHNKGFCRRRSNFQKTEFGSTRLPFPSSPFLSFQVSDHGCIILLPPSCGDRTET